MSDLQVNVSGTFLEHSASSPELSLRTFPLYSWEKKEQHTSPQEKGLFLTCLSFLCSVIGF